MATTKKTWTKPAVRQLSKSEIHALAEQNEPLGELLKSAQRGATKAA